MGISTDSANGTKEQQYKNLNWINFTIKIIFRVYLLCLCGG